MLDVSEISQKKLLFEEPSLRRKGIFEQHLIIATRFWAKSPHDTKRLQAFLDRTNEYGTDILIAINVEADTQDTLRRLSEVSLAAKVEAVPISPWGGVTHALNLLIHHALSKYPLARLVLFQSVEVHASQNDISQLLSVFRHGKGKVLVAGRALPGHVMYGTEGSVPRTENVVVATPWNTFALWDLKMLGETGFPAIADRMDPPGMEEVGAIAMQQKLHGETCRRAFLVCDKGVERYTEFEDERAEAHKQKMNSKRERACTILESIGVMQESTSSVVLIKGCDAMCEGDSDEFGGTC